MGRGEVYHGRGTEMKTLLRLNWGLITVWLVVLALGCTFWWGFFQLAMLVIHGG